MKSFWELVQDWNFAMALTMAFLIAGFDLAYGTKILGASFLLIIMGAIALNLWKTGRKKR
jgi:hypothetical protein